MKVAKATSQPQETAMHLFFENEDAGENYAYTTSEWDLHKMVFDNPLIWFITKHCLNHKSWKIPENKFIL